jgi:hypothetical protein
MELDLVPVESVFYRRDGRCGQVIVIGFALQRDH